MIVEREYYKIPSVKHVAIAILEYHDEDSRSLRLAALICNNIYLIDTRPSIN